MNPTTKATVIEFLHKVQRSRSDRKLGGVCGGLAAHSGIPAWVYRAFFIVLLPTGVGPLGYIALWICMPVEPAPQWAAPPVIDASAPVPKH
jgi:phage shock protein C